VTHNNDWQGKTGGGNLGQKLLFLYFKYGSIAFAYFIVSIVVLFYLPINYKATANIYNYFRLRQGFSLFKSAIATYKNHFVFGKSIVDKFAVFAGRKNAFKIEVIGQEIYDNIINDNNTGALILNSHVGVSEIAGYLLKQNKKKFNALVFGGEAEAIQKYRAEVLSKQNINLIPIVDGFSHFLKIHFAIKNAELIGVAADRTYHGSKNLSCEFLNAKAFFPLNPFQIAHKLKIPVIAFFVMIAGFKKYRVIVANISNNQTIENIEGTYPEKLLKSYVNELENIVKDYPLQWFNFYKFWNE